MRHNRFISKLHCEIIKAFIISVQKWPLIEYTHIRQKPSLPGEKPEQAKVCKASGTKSRCKEVDKGAAQLANHIFGCCAMCNVFQIIECPKKK